MARYPRLIALVLPLLISGVAAQGFRKAFEEAAGLGDRDVLTKIMNQKNAFEDALGYGRALMEELIAKPDERVSRDRLDLLKEMMERVHKTKVLGHMERLFLKGDGAEVLRQLRGLYGDYSGLYPRYQAAVQGDAEAWKEAYEGYMGLGKKYEDIGDMLQAALCYQFAGDLIRYKKEGPKGEQEFVALEGFLRTRESWDLKGDRVFFEWEKRYRYLEGLKSQGKSLDALGEEKPAERTPAVPELAYVPDSKWETAAGRFEAWEQPDKGVYQMTGTYPILWRGVAIRGIFGEGGGEEAGVGKIAGFEPEIRILRSKTSQYEVDGNLDGKPDERIKLGGKPALCVFDRVLEGEKTKGALWFWTGGQQEMLGGLPINIAPQAGPDAFALVYFRGATAMEVDVRGQKILFIDENSSGTFGDSPRLIVAARNNPPGMPHTPYGVAIGDSMILPGQKEPVPCSDFLHLDDGYYKFKFSGMTAKYRKLDMSKTPTGFLKMAWKGPAAAKPRNLVVGEVSVFSGAVFDLAAGKEVEVPAGIYRIFGGLAVAGSGVRMKCCSIGAGKAPQVEVKPGEHKTIQVGAPYTYDFTYIADAGSVRIDGFSVKVFGAGGEVYLDLWEGTPEPEVFVRSGNKGNGKKVGGMAPPKDGEAVNSYRKSKDNKIGLDDAIFAPCDFREKNPFRGAVQVMLVENKHPYFGKVASDWK